MTQTIRVLDLNSRDTYYTYFSPDDDDQPTADKVEVRLPDATWEDLGRPAKITVTIQPGDILNPEDTS